MIVVYLVSRHDLLVFYTFWGDSIRASGSKYYSYLHLRLRRASSSVYATNLSYRRLPLLCSSRAVIRQHFRLRQEPYCTV